jgi:hypothetical protein
MVTGLAIWLSATTPLAIAAAVMIGGLGAVALASGAATILKEALNKNAAVSNEDDTAAKLFGQNPAATTPVYGGAVGSIIQGAINTVKGYAAQVGQNIKKAVEPQNQQNISIAFQSNNLNGAWKGRYSSSAGGGALDATITQAAGAVFFKANVNAQGFGGGVSNGSVNGTVIDVGSVLTQGCTVSIYNGRRASPNSLNGEFTITGDCLKTFNIPKITGAWDLFRPA